MSGMYNMVFGTTAVAPIVLGVLGRKPEYFGRFRDAWVEKMEDGQLRFAVYTRNGGGNRKHYNDAQEAGPECGCPGCVIKHRLPADPLYLSDQNDTLDSTYATVYFRVPPEAADRLKAAGAPESFTLESVAVPPVDTSARWQKAIDSIEAEGRKGRKPKTGN